MGPDNNDHLVSQGWQRLFGTETRRVAVVNAASGRLVDKDRAIRSNFSARGFMTDRSVDGEWNRETDDIFKAIEASVFDYVRGINSGLVDEDQRRAVVQLCAVHLLRSQDFRDKQVQLLDELVPHAQREYPLRQDLHNLFVRHVGAPPVPGVIESYIERWEKRQRSGAVFFDSVEERLATIQAVLARSGLQTIDIDTDLSGLALGDNPVVHAQLDVRRFGFKAGLAVGDATTVMAPLRRHLAVFFTRQPLPPIRVTTLKKVKELNALTAKTAREEVACHPDDALHVQRVCRNPEACLPSGPHLTTRR